MCLLYHKFFFENRFSLIVRRSCINRCFKVACTSPPDQVSRESSWVQWDIESKLTSPRVIFNHGSRFLMSVCVHLPLEVVAHRSCHVHTLFGFSSVATCVIHGLNLLFKSFLYNIYLFNTQTILLNKKNLFKKLFCTIIFLYFIPYLVLVKVQLLVLQKWQLANYYRKK